VLLGWVFGGWGSFLFMDGGNLEINNLEINIQESCAFMDFRPKGKLEINIQESCAFLDFRPKGKGIHCLPKE
jgi:hypothetical protein